MALSARLRLRGSRCFDYVYQRGLIYHGKWMSLRIIFERREYLSQKLQDLPASPFRCSVVVSTKVSKSSVRRNFLRRLLHEILQNNLCAINRDHANRNLDLNPRKFRSRWLILSLKPGSNNVSSLTLMGECISLLAKAGLES
uniref:Bacterial ribonuclease P protein component of ribozyme n=1 Tax=Paulinella chromatophora TaxID=39717 RepID=B1X5C6_PAUCH|nr:bacterial ribonuclease P protein component of ribozyme [Paulinella chromatophora]ACB43145.1 bacterial ribonuclease P protein component of ribozyme [Paulinella chromatophora]